MDQAARESYHPLNDEKGRGEQRSVRNNGEKKKTRRIEQVRFADVLSYSQCQ